MSAAVAPAARDATPHRELDWRHVGLVAWFAGKFELRKGGGILFLFGALFVGLEIAATIITTAEFSLAGRDRHGNVIRDAGAGEESTSEADRVMRSDAMTSTISWVVGTDKRQTDYLLREKPAIISAIALVLLFAFPFLAALGSFNQTAGDIGSRGLRYLLLRTERTNVFFGRFLGTYLFVVAFTTLLMLVILLYVGFKLRVYDVGELIGWGFQCWVALCLLALPYVALSGWISGSVSSAGASLALGGLAAVGPLIVFLMMSSAAPSGSLGWTWKLVPWGWKYQMLDNDLGQRAIGYAAMLGFTALYAAIGLFTFRRRDL